MINRDFQNKNKQELATFLPANPDIPLFLILIPFISAINYYLTYTGIRLNGFLVLTFTIDTLQGYLAWWAVRAFILHLEKRWAYEVRPLRRLAFQLVVSLLIGLGVISLLTELVSWLAKGRPAPLDFYTRDLFIIGIWFFVVNGIYVGLHFYREWQQARQRLEQETRLASQDLVVRQGRQDIRLDLREIAGFSVDGDYVRAILLDQRKYLLDESLDKVEKKLPAAQFFRLNRQVILHRQIIGGFQRRENGKIVVWQEQNQALPVEIPVSRTKAPAFKRWFQPE